MGRAKPLPGGVAKLRWTNEQSALSVIDVALQNLAGNERLAEANLVGDDCSANVPDQPQRAGGAVLLEAGQRQPVILTRQILDLTAVKLEEGAQENIERRPVGKNLFEQFDKVEWDRFLPQALEP